MTDIQDVILEEVRYVRGRVDVQGIQLSKVDKRLAKIEVKASFLGGIFGFLSAALTVLISKIKGSL